LICLAYHRLRLLRGALLGTSAFPSEQVIAANRMHDRFWHLADIEFDAQDVRFRGRADAPNQSAECPLMARLGTAAHRAGRTLTVP
jgi:hypothetical protein